MFKREQELLEWRTISFIVLFFAYFGDTNNFAVNSYFIAKITCVKNMK